MTFWPLLLSHVWFYLDCKDRVQVFLFLVLLLLTYSLLLYVIILDRRLKLLPLDTNFVTIATPSLPLLSYVSNRYQYTEFEFRISCSNGVIYVLDMDGKFLENIFF